MMTLHHVRIRQSCILLRLHYITVFIYISISTSANLMCLFKQCPQKILVSSQCDYLSPAASFWALYRGHITDNLYTFLYLRFGAFIILYSIKWLFPCHRHLTFQTIFQEYFYLVVYTVGDILLILLFVTLQQSKAKLKQISDTCVHCSLNF